MVIKTLVDKNKIGDYDIFHMNDRIEKEEYDRLKTYININHTENTITFKIQDGPVKENGVNGCQVYEIIETAKIIIEGLNKNFACRENSIAITKLEKALM